MPFTQVPALRYWRAQRRLSQGALADQASVSAYTVSRLERGRPAMLATVRCLAEALDVVPGSLMRPPPEPVAGRLRPYLSTLPALRYWRAQRLLTRPALRAGAGLSCQSLYALEHGGRARMSTVLRLAEALGVPHGDLIREPPNLNDGIVTPPTS